MNCDQVLDLVLYVQHAPERQTEVAEHVRICSTCREEIPRLLAAISTIRQAPPSALAGHLTAEQVVGFALDSEGAAPGIDPFTADHATSCATCAAEIDEVRRAEHARQTFPKAGRMGRETRIGFWRGLLANVARPSAPAKVAMATAMGLLVLAYPAYLGVRELPRVKERLRDMQVQEQRLQAEVRGLETTLDQSRRKFAGLRAWSGPLRWYLLSSPVRGQTNVQTVRVLPSEPYVFVAIRPILPEMAAGTTVFRFVISRDDRRVVWRSELTAGEIRQHMRSSGALVFPIPSDLLTPGKWELKGLPERGEREPILQIPFEVVSAR